MRLLAADRARQWAVLLSLLLIPVAYAALAVTRFHRAPGAAATGLAFGLLFAGLEASYRSIDLFAGSRWAAAFLGAQDPVVRAGLAARFALFDDSVAALYFPLLAAHAIASGALAVAAFERRDPWSQALALTLGANAVRALLRILQMHGGLAALSPVNEALYLPVSVAAYGVLAVWLARAAKTATRPAA